MAQQRVLIVSRNTLFAEGITALLSQRPDMAVVGTLRGSAGLRHALRSLQPDAIIADCGDCALVQRLARQAPHLRVIAVTLNDNSLDIYETTHVEMSAPGDLFAAIEHPSIALGDGAQRQEKPSDHSQS